ncbi:MAG: helix-turn-helix domain-containing protein [Polyangiaceae bacterium]
MPTVKRPARARAIRKSRVSPRKEPGSTASNELVQTVLVAARRLLETDGWDGVSTNRIAKAAGVSVGFLYKYFPNREAIARAVVHDFWNSELEVLGRAASAPGASIESVSDAYVDSVAANPRIHAEVSAYLVPLVADDAGAWDEKAVAAVVALFDREYEDDPRKYIACENIYVAAIQITRRAALVRPEWLSSGELRREMRELVRGYLGSFRRRT